MTWTLSRPARNPAITRGFLDVARLCAALLALAASPLAAQDAAESVSSPRVWQQKVSLQLVDAPTSNTPPPLCTLRFLEGGSDLAIACSHRLGSEGELSLVRAGSGARSEPPLWSAPLASPFEAVAALSDDAVTTLLAGELALRIDTGAAVAEGGIGTPIFDDGFDYFKICRWSNFLCADDNNVCTTTTCSSTGVCGTEPNTMPCDVPNATGGCFLGGCIIQSCDAGYSHCDTSNANGCEVNHNTGPGTCTTLVNFVGEYSGDTSCNFPACNLNNNGNVFATRTGRGEAFYSAQVVEASSCLGSIEHGIELSVPEGVDYDLYVYRDCKLVASSTAAAGVDEFVRVEAEEDPFATDSFHYQVEVRWYPLGGTSCEEWTLKFSGLTC